jgi:hypothetical protein
VDVDLGVYASVEVYIRPKPLPGKKSGWVQTGHGKGSNMILRLHRPLEPFYVRSRAMPNIENAK